MDDRAIGRAVAVNWQNLALGHEVLRIDSATLVRNRALPNIYDANFVFGITVSESADIDRLLERVAREYAHAEQVTFRVDPSTPPPFEARLVMEGYSRSDALLLVLDGPLRGNPATCEVLRIQDDSMWQAYVELKRRDWDEYSTTSGLDAASSSVAEGLASSNRLKSPPVEYMLARENGQPVGFCSAWTGIEGMGQVEDLFVHPDYRHRGIATALLASCVTRLRAQGVGPVVLVTDPAATTKAMYGRLGWFPVAVCRQYGKRIAHEQKTGSNQPV